MPTPMVTEAIVAVTKFTFNPAITINANIQKTAKATGITVATANNADRIQISNTIKQAIIATGTDIFISPVVWVRVALLINGDPVTPIMFKPEFALDESTMFCSSFFMSGT